VTVADRTRTEAKAIRISKGEHSRNINISLDKSVVVRLPVAARDVLVGNPSIDDVSLRFTVLDGSLPASLSLSVLDDSGNVRRSCC